MRFRTFSYYVLKAKVNFNFESYVSGGVFHGKQNPRGTAIFYVYNVHLPLMHLR